MRRGARCALFAARRFTTLPVIDVAPLVSAHSTLAARQAVGAQLDAACREVGFFNIVGHGVPDSTTRGVLSASRRWFNDTPDAEKLALSLSPATGFRGYAPLRKNVTQGARAACACARVRPARG